MATTTNLLSWEAFEKLPDDGMHHELIEGEHQVLPPPKLRHAEVARRLSRALQILEDRGLGRVYLEGGYKLSQNPATWIQPDISFVTENRYTNADPDGYFMGSPYLAVEVISPSESALSKGLSAPGRGSMIRARTSPRSKISGGRKQWR